MNRKASPFWLVTLVPLLLAFPNCNHQQPVDAGTGTAGSTSAPDDSGKPHPWQTGGASHVTGGAAATGGNAATGGKSSTPSSSGPADACELAGQRLKALNCTQQTTPKGIPFATACRNAQAQKLNWHPECIVKVAKCSDVPNAYRGCKP